MVPARRSRRKEVIFSFLRSGADSGERYLIPGPREIRLRRLRALAVRELLERHGMPVHDQGLPGHIRNADGRHTLGRQPPRHA